MKQNKYGLIVQLLLVFAVLILLVDPLKMYNISFVVVLPQEPVIAITLGLILFLI